MKNLKSSLISNYLPYIPEFYLKRKHPNYIVIEVTNSCNLNCQFCLTSDETRERGLMSLENFKKIIDKLPPQIQQIDLDFSGEPLLNKDVFKMVKYAKQNGISTFISTNATFLDKFDPKEIIDSGLGKIAVCVDGASKETHEFYRRNSDFEQVKNNIKRLCSIKEMEKSRNPVITMQTLITKRNEHEIPKIEMLAKDLGVDKLYLRKMSISNYEGKSKLDAAKEELPSEKYSMYRIENDKVIILDEPKYCYAIFNLVVLWNGDVTTCCFDYDGENVYGNLLKSSFKDIWDKVPRKRIINRRFPLCDKCELSSDIDYKIIELNDD